MLQNIELLTGLLHPNKKKPAEINHKSFEFPDWNYNGLSTSDSIS